jgi:DNA-binding transcriptional MerR regulator
MSPTKTFSISDLAKHFDVTPRAIRFYEAQGLLSPKRINAQRVYNDGDFVRLKLILRGKRIGFSLAELKQTISLYDTQPDSKAQLRYVLETIDSHRLELLERKQDIETTLDDMDDVEARIKEQLRSF